MKCHNLHYLSFDQKNHFAFVNDYFIIHENYVFSPSCNRIQNRSHFNNNSTLFQFRFILLITWNRVENKILSSKWNFYLLFLLHKRWNRHLNPIRYKSGTNNGNHIGNTLWLFECTTVRCTVYRLCVIYEWIVLYWYGFRFIFLLNREIRNRIWWTQRP